MLQLLASVLIDAIDASPLEDATVIGIPLVALIEGGIIYWTTKSKTLAVIGIAESIVPVVDIIPFASISWGLKHKKIIGVVVLAILLIAVYLLGWFM